MNADWKRGLLAFLLILCLQPADAQDFAGLGSGGDGFAQVLPGHTLAFPADHGAHPDYRIEWWYVTANLKDAAGKIYGVQWTLFRQALRAPADVPASKGGTQFWMGHAALTTKSDHRQYEALARGGTGQADVATSPFHAWIDAWDLAAAGPGIDDLRMRAAGTDFHYDLTLHAEAPLVLQGDAGHSVKSASGQASYYYSQPFFSASGTITIDGTPVAVTGRAWLDHEWSSRPLAADQLGWDWLSLHFDDGTALMLFQLRDSEGGHFRSGSWAAPDGTVRRLTDVDIEMTPLARNTIAGHRLPTKWRIEVMSLGMRVTIEACNPNSWMNGRFAYWEGPVSANGSEEGEGYLEMTGY